MKTAIVTVLALGLLTGPMAAQAIPVSFNVAGVFSSDSTVTPGLAGDSYSLVVTVDDAIAPGPVSVGWQFSGSAELIVDGMAVATDFGAVLQGVSAPGSFQLTAALTGGAFFTGFFSDAFNPAIIFPLGSNVLADPAVVSAQGIVGFTDEFTAALVFSRVGNQATLIPEPATLALLGLGLAGLGFSRRKRAIN